MFRERFHIRRHRFDAETFKHFETLKDAQAYLYSLPPRERLKIWTVPPSERRFAITPREGDPFPLLGLSKEESVLSLCDRPPATTGKQAEALYKKIYRLMEAAKKQAEAEGKPLRIVVGEYHTSRTDLMITNMIISIAKELEIDRIGIEGGDRRIGGFPDFADIFQEARDHMEQYGADGTVIPENANDSSLMPEGVSMLSAMPEGMRQNQIFQMEAALEAGYRNETIFDSSPLRDEAENGDYDPVCARTAKVLMDLSRQKQSCVAIIGGMHLLEVKEKLENDNATHTLFINTSHNPYNWSAAWHIPQFADSEILNNRNASKLAQSNEIIQIMAEGGQVESARQAFDLSRYAEAKMLGKPFMFSFFNRGREKGQSR